MMRHERVEPDIDLTWIQTLVLPHISQQAPQELYVRTSAEKTLVALADARVHLRAGGRLWFDTYFNSLTVRTWKQDCNILDLVLALSGAGRFQVRLGLHAIGQSHRWLCEQEVTIEEGKPAQVLIGAWHQIDAGMLYLYVECLDDGYISGGGFATSTAPRRNVKLGLVITHFNRKHYTLPAIRRIKAELLSDPRYASRIELIVVDNSRNISEGDADEITLLPNMNLGGSGGFTRGLMHLEDQGGFTHCLFMDDDASCDIESLRRAYHILSFVNEEKTAVAGGLLRENEPFSVHEIGGLFDGCLKPLKACLDVRHVHDLLLTETHIQRPNYGAWWFFGFALKAVEHYPFPFFVRGDDALFSLLNKFKIITMNGIACWGEDFSWKENPRTRYLGARSTLVLILLQTEKDAQFTGKILRGLLMGALRSYLYASAEAVNLAIEHAMEGPQFWTRNIDMSAVFRQIGGFSAGEEILSATDLQGLPLDAPRRRKHRVLRSILSTLTLNGVLLPDIWLKDSTLQLPKSYAADPGQLFLYKSVYYHHEPTGTGFCAKHDKMRFIKQYLRMWKNLRRLRRDFLRLRAEYREFLPKVTAREFWEDVYAAPNGAVGPFDPGVQSKATEQLSV